MLYTTDYYSVSFYRPGILIEKKEELAGESKVERKYTKEQCEELAGES